MWVRIPPEFGHDNEGKSIYEHVKAKVFEEWQEKIDYRYENLFIFSESEADVEFKKFALIGRLMEIYQEIQPHSMYDLIAKIPFSAIINCSNDGFLEAAMKKERTPYTLDYYSGDGYFKEDPENLPSDTKTSICNVFGKLTDSHSFIVTYDMFFAFLSSIMSENQSLPVHLSDKIAKAELFLLMGFDITKWYIPLLVYRLNRYGQNAKSSFHKRWGLINEIDTHNNDATIALKTFPLKIKILAEGVIESIETLYNKLTVAHSKPIPTGKTPSILTELMKSVQQEDIENVISEFFEYVEPLNIKLEELILIKGRFKDLKKQELLGLIPNEEINTGRMRIRKDLIDLIKNTGQALL